MLEIDITLPRDAFRLELSCRLAARTTGVFGPSGAGKTSALLAVAGLHRPERGRIVLDGRVLFDDRRGIHLPPHRREIGVVFQDNRLFPHYTVRRNLLYGSRWKRHLRRGSQRFAFEQIVDLLELRPLLGRPTPGLSGGEQRRVALGRALLGSPRLLLLDEPLAGVDHRRRADILRLLRRVQDELHVPMLLVSHELGEILHLTDELVVLDRGAVAGAGRLTDLIHQPRPLALIHGGGLLNVVRLAVREHRPDEGRSLLDVRAAPEKPHGETSQRETPRGETACGETSRGEKSRGAVGAGETPARRPPLLSGPLLADQSPGAGVDAVLRPEDIALALAPIEHTSMQNQLRGRVRRIVEALDATLCLVDVGFPLLVEVTAKAISDLDLRPGKDVWCLFKTRALQCVAITGQRTSARETAPFPGPSFGTLPAALPAVSARAVSEGGDLASESRSASPPGGLQSRFLPSLRAILPSFPRSLRPRKRGSGIQ